MEHHAEGTGEKVWAHRRSKTPLLGRVRGRGAAGQRNLPEHVCWGSQRAGHLWHRLWVTGNFLCGLRAEPGLSATWCLLRDLQAAGTDRGGQSSLRPEVGMACHHRGPESGLHLWPQSSQRPAKKKKKKKKREHCNQTLPVLALTLLGTHPPCSCQCQMLWAVSRHLITVLSQDPTTRSSWLLLAWSAGGRGKPPQLSLTPEVGMAHHH